jgi:2-keto-3-deoxy-L-rhamnonate aldolase
MSLSPQIDTKNFRVYSGFGQQLGPIVVFGAAGVIDGLASIYPKTVTKLFKLATTRPLTDEVLKELQELQYIVSHAEEFVVARGIIGMREGIYRELGMGTMAGRLPIQGSLPDGDFDSWKSGQNALAKISELEKS